jgi:hypothetical protein
VLSPPDGLLKRTEYILLVQGKIVIIHISLFERRNDEFENLKILLEKRRVWFNFVTTQLPLRR